MNIKIKMFFLSRMYEKPESKYSISTRYMWSKAVYNVTTLNNKRDITEPHTCTYQTKNNQQLTTSVGHILKQVDHILFINISSCLLFREGVQYGIWNPYCLHVTRKHMTDGWIFYFRIKFRVL